LRSAQRFFIASDNRFLPSGVMPPRFLPFVAGRLGSDGLRLLDSEWRVGIHQRRNRSTDPISFLLQVRNYSF